MPLTKDKYFELIDSNSDYPHFRCALGAYIPGSLYKYFSIPDDSDEARKRFEQLKSGEIWFSKRSGLNDPFEFEHIALKGAQNDARQYYLNKQQELEVCCFSALLYNKLMWSHYAAGYKGYCVEFRVESPERFYPVIYENEVPDLSQEYQRFYDMRNEMCANPSLVLNNYENRKVLLRINYPLFSKDTCWSYEEEYRILDSSNTELDALHLGDDAIEVLKAGQFNHRLLSELICHKDFQRLMLDAEIYVDRIADMRINDMNTVLEAVRQMVLSKREDSANDLYLRTLELAQVPEEEYFSHVVSDDLNEILRDIREAHKTDSTTADEPSAAAQVQQQLQTAMNFEGSSDEKKARALLATLGIDYDAITKEQFVNLIEVLRLSKHMKNPINRRGKSNMTHGKGKRKRK